MNDKRIVFIVNRDFFVIDFADINIVRNFANNKQYTKLMSDKENNINQEQLARFAKAMGHPTRIAILQFLAKQTTCYFGDINEELPIAKATVSQHLKELKSSGLIHGEVEPPKVKYCINREMWDMACSMFKDFFANIQHNDSCNCK